MRPIQTSVAFILKNLSRLGTFGIKIQATTYNLEHILAIWYSLQFRYRQLHVASRCVKGRYSVGLDGISTLDLILLLILWVLSRKLGFGLRLPFLLVEMIIIMKIRPWFRTERAVPRFDADRYCRIIIIQHRTILQVRIRTVTHAIIGIAQITNVNCNASYCTTTRILLHQSQCVIHGFIKALPARIHVQIKTNILLQSSCQTRYGRREHHFGIEDVRRPAGNFG
mmetsp:Transcript_1909/g.4079  ORF Transcript_1909/g.4079 Transcript_1909/m.4079 type:complete len:225 (+) Transcript_1909:1320-1994(+)